MKESPSDKELRERLGPSKFSGEGFLGTDTRSINEIISNDLSTLEKARITPEEVADFLLEIYSKAVKSMGAETEVLPGFSARYHESMGRIPSPFRGEGTFSKGDVIVKNIKTGDEAVITSLSIHLIRKHSFFQGKGSRYRINPEQAAELIKMKNHRND